MAVGSNVIKGIITIIIGAVMLPVGAYFVGLAQNNSSVKAVAGVTNVLDIVVYGICFGLVFIGIGMIRG